MAEIDAAYIARKERAIADDLKTAFSCNDRLIRHLGEIRRWTVTVEVAALGVALSGKLATLTVIMTVAVLSLLSFLILELRERSSMRFNKGEVLRVEQIFMIKDPAEYARQVQEFEFRDLRLSKFDRATKLNHLFASVFDLNIGLWYGFWFGLVAVTWLTLGRVVP
jgi:hypothetical protein